MKNSSKTAFILSFLWLAYASSALAGGVEISSPRMWDVYIGGSAVAYGYEHRISSAVLNLNSSISESPDSSFDQITKYRNIGVLGGFDIGVGIWADRGYFGIEGRYDIGQITAQNMVNNLGMGSGATPPPSVYTITYTAAMSSNGFILLKLGYQLLPRTMSYVLLGWARINYKLFSRVFFGNVGATDDTPNSTANLQGAIEQFSGQIYKKSLNGGSIGIGIAHTLVDGLSGFAELGWNAYHVSSEIVVASANPNADVSSVIHSNNILNFNYYSYTFRVGLNWSFASLI